MTPELSVILNDAKNEIKRLRQQNQLMGARLGVFDQMMQLFNNYPQNGGLSASPDVVYEIERYQDRESVNVKENVKPD